MNAHRLTLALATALTPACAFAHAPSDDAPQVAEVVITGSRAPEGALLSTLASADVLTAEQLERRQVRDLVDALRDLPGVAVSTAPGQTQVRLRGTEANHVLTLIDGIEASDAFTGEFEFGSLQSAPGARLEVLRGARSALYGSDAVGGVVHLITASGREDPGVQARLEAGSFGTVQGAARLGGAAGDGDYALTVSALSTDGAPNARGGSRDLGRETLTAAFKGGWRLSDAVGLRAVVRGVDRSGDYNESDNDPTSPTFGLIVDSPGVRYEEEAVYGLAAADLTLLDGRLTSTLSIQGADIARENLAFDTRTYGWTGDRVKASLETTYRWGGPVAQRLTGAIDLETEGFRSRDPSGFAFTGRREVETRGAVVQYEAFAGGWSLGAAARHDDNDLFADATTYRVQGALDVLPGTRLHAAAGSGVKNPGFYELYGFSDGRYIGNPNLKPERSEGWEAGVRHEIGAAWSVEAVWFDATLEDEIFTTYPAPDFIATPANRTTESTQSGLELRSTIRPSADWRVDIAATWLDAAEDGVEEVRRPGNTASLAVDWRDPAGRGGLNLVVRHVGATDDVAFTDPSYVPVRVRLGSYTLVNLAGDLALGDRASLFGRIENLLDEDREEVFSFVSPGRAAYVGVSLKY
ncbi:TonB-dependent receptor plug domain-containing protein [Brevundimonas balnearis]|uniref:TonB-dependent receptor plug domain-containing protein n=1 Tax=Brevundimonas balnearis TaxID=1572858 RepID=A0ABV6R3S0_9CAUL